MNEWFVGILESGGHNDECPDLAEFLKEKSVVKGLVLSGPAQDLEAAERIMLDSSPQIKIVHGRMSDLKPVNNGKVMVNALQ